MNAQERLLETIKQGRSEDPPQNIEASLAQMFEFLFVCLNDDAPEHYRLMWRCHREIMKAIRTKLEYYPEWCPTSDILAEENKKRRETAERARQ